MRRGRADLVARTEQLCNCVRRRSFYIVRIVIQHSSVRAHLGAYSDADDDGHDDKERKVRHQEAARAVHTLSYLSRSHRNSEVPHVFPTPHHRQHQAYCSPTVRSAVFKVVERVGDVIVAIVAE